MRILIVDDDYTCRATLKAILAAYGDCDGVPDGELALTMLQKAYEEAIPYDLVTMDIDMPGMSGPDVVDAIRAWEHARGAPRTGENVNILMVTIHDDPASVISSFRKGCEWYLTKPATPATVRGALAKLGLSV